MTTFTVEFIEVKKELLFVAGTALSSLELGAGFRFVYQYGKKQGSKELKGSVDLSIQTILRAGEAIETAKVQESLMLILEGEGQALLDAAIALKWQEKNGRIFRTSEAALSLESDET